MKARKKSFGRFVVADAKVCHGQPVFRGTRILVADVLEQVASGMAWEAIVEEWRGAISEQGITEAVRLATLAFAKHADEFAIKPAA